MRLVWCCVTYRRCSLYAKCKPPLITYVYHESSRCRSWMNNSIASQSTCTVVIAFSNYSFNNSIRILSLYRSSFPSLIISPETKSLFFRENTRFHCSSKNEKKNDITFDRRENGEFQGILCFTQFFPTEKVKTKRIRYLIAKVILISSEDKTRHNFAGETRKEGGKNRHSSVIKLEWYRGSDVPPKGGGGGFQWN